MKYELLCAMAVFVEDGDSQERMHLEMAEFMDARTKAGSNCVNAFALLHCSTVYLPCNEVKMGGGAVAIPSLPCKKVHKAPTPVIL